MNVQNKDQRYELMLQHNHLDRLVGFAEDNPHIDLFQLNLMFPISNLLHIDQSELLQVVKNQLKEITKKLKILGVHHDTFAGTLG